MANSVSDIIINITANASNALQGLNQVRSTVQETVNSTGSGFRNFGNNAKQAGDLVEQNMGNAANALGMFEKQAGIHFQAGGNQITGFGGRITTFGKNLQANLRSAGNSVSNFGRNVQEKMGTQSAMAFAAAGAAALSFSKQCITGAMNAESAWSRYGALVNSSGGNWQAQSKEVKAWARDVSNSYGYAVSDTREASAALMQAGNSYDFVKNNMSSVAALAARTGTTQTEAANMITMALNGRANALRKATGLEIENYRAADGTIDKQRLMTDILNQNKDALEAHSDTTEAAVARMENSWNSFKTSLGQAMLPVIQTLVPIIQGIADAFNKLPAPVKTAIAAFLLIGGAIGVVLGFVGLIAPAIVTIGGLISSIAGAGGVIAWLGTQVTMVSAAFPILGTVFGFVAANLLPIIAIVGAVVGVLYLLYEAGKRLGWWSDLGGMFQKFGETLTWVGGQIMGFIQWLGLLVTDFPQAMSKLGDFVNNIGPAISGFLSQLGPLLGEMGNIIGEALGGLGDMIAEHIGNGDLSTGILRLVAPIPMIIFNALSYIAPMVGPALEGLGNWILNGLSSALGGLGSAIVGALQGLGQWVSDGLSNALSDIPGTIGRIIDATPVGQIASSLGLKLSDAFRQLPGMITGALGGIGGAIAGALGNLGNSVDGGGVLSGIRAMLTPIPTLVGTLLARVGPIARQTLANGWTAITAMFSQLGSRILSTITTIPTRVGMAFMRLVTIIRLRINQARAVAGTVMASLRNIIINRIMSIPGRVGQIFSLFVQMIRTRIIRAAAQARQGANQIKQAIVDRISQMYTDAQNWFNNLASNIASWLSTAASNAISGAKQIYDNIVNKIKEIPKAVGDELAKIPGKISSALASAASAAASGAANIVSSFLSGMGINSPGKIQRWSEWEFQSVPDNMELSGVEASRNAYKAASDIVRSWNTGMTPLGTPKIDFTASSVMDEVGGSLDVQLLSSNIARMTPIPTQKQASVDNSKTTNNDNTRHITVENITLECNDLTQAQSRRILYNALQGL